MIEEFDTYSINYCTVIINDIWTTTGSNYFQNLYFRCIRTWNTLKNIYFILLIKGKRMRMVTLHTLTAIRRLRGVVRSTLYTEPKPP